MPCVAYRDLEGPVWAHRDKQPTPGKVFRTRPPRAGSPDSNSNDSCDQGARSRDPPSDPMGPGSCTCRGSGLIPTGSPPPFPKEAQPPPAPLSSFSFSDRPICRLPAFFIEDQTKKVCVISEFFETTLVRRDPVHLRFPAQPPPDPRALARALNASEAPSLRLVGISNVVGVGTSQGSQRQGLGRQAWKARGRVQQAVPGKEGAGGLG